MKNSLSKYLLLTISLLFFCEISFCDINLYNSCYEVDDISEERAKIRESKYNYLCKYIYALNNPLPNSLSPQNKLSFWIDWLKHKLIGQPFNKDYYDNCIWTLWFQGKDKAPPIIKNCFRSIVQYSKGRKVIILGEKDIPNYIDLPEYIWEKYKRKIIPMAQFSDIVRYCLLYKYGGTWIDSTVLMTGAIPEKITKQKLFMFSILRGTRHSRQSLTANWFIHAKKGNAIIKDIINLNFEYWKKENTLLHYFINYFFFTLAVRNDKEAAEIFNKMPYYPERLTLYPKLKEPYNSNLFKDLIKKDDFPIHKITYKLKHKYPGSLFEYLSRDNLSL